MKNINFSDLDNVSRQIQDNQQEIISRLKQDDVDVYQFLVREYQKGNVRDNLVFQFVFRSFYRLDNAGLGDALKRKYFDLMSGGTLDLELVLSDLYKVPTAKNKHALQFSFATKLLNMVDARNPIYDAEVSRVFNLRVPGSTIRINKRLAHCAVINELLKKTYSDLLRQSEVVEVIKKARDKFSVNSTQVSDIKMLDFIIWQLGKIIKNHGA